MPKTLNIGDNGLIKFYNWETDTQGVFTKLWTTAQRTRDRLRASPKGKSFSIDFDERVQFTDTDLATCHKGWDIISKEEVHPIETYLICLIKRLGKREAVHDFTFQTALRDCRAHIKNLNKKSADYINLQYLLEGTGDFLSDASLQQLIYKRNKMAEVIQVPIIYTREAKAVERKMAVCEHKRSLMFVFLS